MLPCLARQFPWPRRNHCKRRRGNCFVLVQNVKRVDACIGEDGGEYSRPCEVKNSCSTPWNHRPLSAPRRRQHECCINIGTDSAVVPKKWQRPLARARSSTSGLGGPHLLCRSLRCVLIFSFLFFEHSCFICAGGRIDVSAVECSALRYRGR